MSTINAAELLSTGVVGLNLGFILGVVWGAHWRKADETIDGECQCPVCGAAWDEKI